MNEDLGDERDDVRRRVRQEARRAPRSQARCRDIMTREIVVATRATTLEDVAQMMRETDTGVIPIVEPVADETASNKSSRVMTNHGKLVGLVTDRDLVVRAVAEGKDARTTQVEDVLTREVHTAQPNDRVIDVIRRMGDKQVRRMPVVDDEGNLRGIISMADIALETEADEELARALEEISSGASFWSRVFG